MAIPKTIIFIGPQGSGKGTQAKLLAEKAGALLIGTGSMFRKIAKEDTEFGRYIRDLIDNGLLASDADVEKVIAERLKEDHAEQPIIFDGVPRRLSQAEWLVNFMHLSGKSDIATFYINLPREIAAQRMSLRRICSKCETPTTVLDDRDDHKCDKCGGALVQRADDMPEAINKRLDIYYRDTLPVLEYLQDKSNFYEIDGRQSIQEVERQIDQILGV